MMRAILYTIAILKTNMEGSYCAIFKLMLFQDLILLH